MKNLKSLTLIASLTLASGCIQSNAEQRPTPQETSVVSSSVDTKTAIFAGGCFWCIESDFEKLEGVIEALSGYSGGHLDNPTYKQVSHENTGHFEVVQVEYDPMIVSYDALLNYYWRHVDPTDAGGQFCDRGDSYKTAVFVNDEAERDIAVSSKDGLQQSQILDAPIVTPILDAGTFWRAEEYHQDYYKKNPIRYKYYRNGCGRDDRVAEVWRKEAAHKQ